jgi:hypothetical protein
MFAFAVLLTGDLGTEAIDDRFSELRSLIIA